MEHSEFVHKMHSDEVFFLIVQINKCSKFVAIPSQKIFKNVVDIVVLFSTIFFNKLPGESLK